MFRAMKKKILASKARKIVSSYRKGSSLRSLAKRLHKSPSTIRRVLKKQGVRVRRQGRPRKSRK